MRGTKSILLSLLLLAAPGVAFAHGRLKSSSPANGAHLGTAPRELRLDFSEAPDLTFSSVKLVGTDGLQIALGPLGYSTESRRTLVAAITRRLAEVDAAKK